MVQLLDLYVERFNRRDWDGLRELIADDARLRVADRFGGRLTESPYFGNYERLAAWRMAVGEVDGEPAIITLHHGADAWTPRSVVRLEFADRHIVRIVDYTHCAWVLPAALSVRVADRS